MEWQGAHLSYLGDLEYLDHLEYLGDVMEGKMIKILKVLNILMAVSLSTLPISMRSARKKFCARLQRTSTDVM